jgi:hypothetical protein
MDHYGPGVPDARDVPAYATLRTCACAPRTLDGEPRIPPVPCDAVLLGAVWLLPPAAQR